MLVHLFSQLVSITVCCLIKHQFISTSSHVPTNLLNYCDIKYLFAIVDMTHDNLKLIVIFLGIDYKKRGDLVREYVRVIAVLWLDTASSGQLTSNRSHHHI